MGKLFSKPQTLQESRTSASTAFQDLLLASRDSNEGITETSEFEDNADSVQSGLEIQTIQNDQLEEEVPAIFDNQTPLDDSVSAGLEHQIPSDMVQERQATSEEDKSEESEQSSFVGDPSCIDAPIRDQLPEKENTGKEREDPSVKFQKSKEIIIDSLKLMGKKRKAMDSSPKLENIISLTEEKNASKIANEMASTIKQKNLKKDDKTAAKEEGNKTAVRKGYTKTAEKKIKKK